MLHRMDLRTRRARVAVAMCYFAQGFCFAALLTQTNVLKDRFSFSDGELSLVLLVVPVVAGIGSVLSGLAAGRFGSALVLRAGGLLVALAVAATGASASRPQLFAALFGVGLGLGVVDAAMNMQGVAVERRYGRPVLSSLHGVWSVGAMSGALATAATAGAGLTTAQALGLAAAVGAAVSLAAGPRLLKTDEATTSAPERAAGVTSHDPKTTPATRRSVRAPVTPVGCPTRSSALSLKNPA